MLSSSSTIENKNTPHIHTTKTEIKGLEELTTQFKILVQNLEEGFYLNLSNEDAFDRQAHGIYKSIPYYEKIYPMDESYNRFIIQKHPFTNTFELIKIQDWLHLYDFQYFTKSIKSIDYNNEFETDKDMNVINFMVSIESKMNELKRQNAKLRHDKENIITEVKNRNKEHKNLLKQKEIEFQKKEEDLQQKEQDFQKKVQNQIEMFQDEKEKFNEFKFTAEEKIKIEYQNIEILKFKIQDKLNQLKLKNENNEKIICENEIQIKSLKTQLKISQEENSGFDYLNKHLKEENKRLDDIQKNKETKIKNELENIKKKQKEFETLEKNIKNLEMENKKLSEAKKRYKSTYEYFELENKKLITENEQFTDFNRFLNKEYVAFNKVKQYFGHTYSTFSEKFPITFNENFDNKTKQKLKMILTNYYTEGGSFDFSYESALMDYGRFLCCEYLRSSKLLNIPESIVFHPSQLKTLPDGESEIKYTVAEEVPPFFK